MTDDPDKTFGALVYEYLTTLVPYWRVRDEAWPLADEQHLLGIGVERNFGGQLMIVPSRDGVLPHPRWPHIEADLKSQGIALERVVVVVDDRLGNDGATPVTPFVEIPWSARERLEEIAIKDHP